MCSSTSRRAIFIIGFLVFSLFSSAGAQAEESASSAKVRKAITAVKSLFRKKPSARSNFYPSDYNESDFRNEIVSYFKNNAGEDVPVRYNSIANMTVDLGFALNASKDRSNVLRLYKLIYSKLPRKFRRNVTSYNAVKDLTLPQLNKKFRMLSRYIQSNLSKILQVLPTTELVITPPQTNPILDCSGEIGAETAGTHSEVSARCSISDYNTDGLFINVDFPLKDNITCIKDQGRRGTCGAHAIAATVETLELQRGGPAKNLSEQHIYHSCERYGDSQISVVDMQTSGLSVGTCIQEYENLQLPLYYESDWNYNRSINIDPITFDGPTATFRYPDSCDAQYTGEECSDYVWQTDADLPTIAFPEPDPAPSGSTVANRIPTFTFLFGDGIGGIDARVALDTSIILLSADVPVLLTMTTTQAFQDSTDGYVRYSVIDTPRGGHAVEMVGFVSNDMLPVGATPATERGYFIIKNSWGTAAGDCGFYYFDYAYLLRFMDYISIIGIS